MALLFIPTRSTLRGWRDNCAGSFHARADGSRGERPQGLHEENKRRDEAFRQRLRVARHRPGKGSRRCAATKWFTYGKLGATFSLLLDTCSPAGFARSISSFTLDRCSVWFVEST